MKHPIYAQKQFVVILLLIFFYKGLWKVKKIAGNWKKHSVSICVQCQYLWKTFPYSDLKVSQVTSVGKTSKNISRLRRCLSLKKFFSRFSLLRQHFGKPSNQNRETFSAELTWTNIETKYHFWPSLACVGACMAEKDFQSKRTNNVLNFYC